MFLPNSATSLARPGNSSTSNTSSIGTNAHDGQGITAHIGTISKAYDDFAILENSARFKIKTLSNIRLLNHLGEAEASRKMRDAAEITYYIRAYFDLMEKTAVGLVTYDSDNILPNRDIDPIRDSGRQEGEEDESTSSTPLRLIIKAPNKDDIADLFKTSHEATVEEMENFNRLFESLKAHILQLKDKFITRLQPYSSKAATETSEMNARSQKLVSHFRDVIACKVQMEQLIESLEARIKDEFEQEALVMPGALVAARPLPALDITPEIIVKIAAELEDIAKTMREKAYGGSKTLCSFEKYVTNSEFGTYEFIKRDGKDLD